MKKRLLLPLFLILPLAAGCSSVVSGDMPYQSRKVPYYRQASNPEKSIDLRFYETTPNVPYVGVRTFYKEFCETEYSCSRLGSVYAYKTSEGAQMTFRPGLDSWSIYGADHFAPGLGHPSTETKKGFLQFKEATGTDFQEKTIALGDYGIDVHNDQEDIYLPLSVLSDFAGGQSGYAIVYNGECLYGLDPNGAYNEKEEARDPNYFGDAYFQRMAKLDTPRPLDLIAYTYAGLCLTFDHFRGQTTQLLFGDERLRTLGLNRLLGTHYPAIRTRLISPDWQTYFAGYTALFSGLYDGGHTIMQMDRTFRSVHVGVGVPKIQAHQGDAYLDLSSYIAYHYWNGYWRQGQSIRGSSSNSVYWMNDVPADSYGADGGYWLNTNNGDIYRKKNGHWKVESSIFDPNTANFFYNYASLANDSKTLDLLNSYVSKTNGKYSYRDSLIQAKKNAFNFTIEENLAFQNYGFYYRYQSDKKTAYIGFDVFATDQDAWDSFYRNHKSPALAPVKTDTYAFLRSKLYQAKQDGAKYVILDLSSNHGGSVGVLLGLLGLFNRGLGYYDYAHVVDGNSVHLEYDVDINLDGIFDERDKEEAENLMTFKIGVLTTGYSFSCGNLFPTLMKDLGYPIVGQPGGGGSCILGYGSTADGLPYYRSGPIYLLNGKGENVDGGVPVDLDIASAKRTNSMGAIPYYYDYSTISRYLINR